MASLCVFPSNEESMKAETEILEEATPLHSFVEEADELLNSVTLIAKNRGMVDTSLVQRSCAICDKYDEQPQLLDPFLENIILPLATIIREEAETAESANWTGVKRICHLLLRLAKVRGSKTVAQFFPHGPEDLEPILALLERCKEEEKKEKLGGFDEDQSGQTWEVCSVLLLWLSILALVPFDLVSVDTSLSQLPSWEEAMKETPPLAQRMVTFCWAQLASTSRPVMTMAALLLSRLLTRPDMHRALHRLMLKESIFYSPEDVPDEAGEVGDSFVQKACEVVEAKGEGSGLVRAQFILQGVLSTLAVVFKVGGRDVLLREASRVWTGVADPILAQKSAKSDSLLRKLRMKLIQRVALVQLPPRLASWRYQMGKYFTFFWNKRGDVTSLTGVGGGEGVQRGSRLLSHTTPTNKTQDKPRSQNDQTGLHGNRLEGIDSGELNMVDKVGYKVETNENEEDDIDVPEIVEDVIQQLLDGLRDKDTPVRWSAAKGLGRITGRLPLVMADDVREAITGLLHPAEGDGAWHGGCLAIAELARRGLLLPHRLPDLVPFVNKALHYEVQQGAFSVGSHVRDAASYVCWAFARAYSPAVMRTPLRQLAPALLTTVCYDREVKCRRAAAAAFQEAVGRQGDFPNGIAIVSTADFASLGALRHSYCHVAPGVARFEPYTRPLAMELLSAKVQHWDRAVRELAAEALALLVPLDPNFFQGPVVDQLEAATCAGDLRVRHGSVMALSAILPALYKDGLRLTLERQLAIANVVPRIERAQLYRGKGGEMMRVSAMRLVESIAMSSLPLDKASHEVLLKSVEANLSQVAEEVQTAAASAFGALAREYKLGDFSMKVSTFTERQVNILENNAGSSVTCLMKRGATLALGALPRELLFPLWRRVLASLCHTATVTKSSETDVEMRVNAIMALGTCCNSLGVETYDPSSLLLVEKEVGNEGERERERGVSPRRSQENGAACVPLSEMVGLVVETLLLALEDYTKDHRGDVGSLVREAAMTTLLDVICLMGNASPREMDQLKLKEKSQLVEDPERGNFDASVEISKTSENPSEGGGKEEPEIGLDGRLVSRVLGALAKQGVERIGRTRAVAGKVLHSLLWAFHGDGRPLLLCVPRRQELEELLPQNMYINWKNEEETYPRLVPLIALPEYRSQIIAGLVLAIGDLVESLSVVATSATMDLLTSPHEMLAEVVKREEWEKTDFLREKCSDYGVQTVEDGEQVKIKLTRILGRELLFLIEHHSQNIRVVVPALKMMMQILDEPFGEEAVKQVGRVLKGRGARVIQNLHPAVNIFCHFIAWDLPRVPQEASAKLFMLLGNGYPTIRQYCAEQMYLQLLTIEGSDCGLFSILRQACSEEEVGEREEEVLDLLSNTEWIKPLEEISVARERLRELIPLEL